MRAMLWDNWRGRYATVSDPAPEPDFHHYLVTGAILSTRLLSPLTSCEDEFTQSGLRMEVFLSHGH